MGLPFPEVVQVMIRNHQDQNPMRFGMFKPYCGCIVSCRHTNAENELEKTVKFIEVKRNAARISMDVLKAKTDAFLRATGEYAGYAKAHLALSLKDM